MPDSLTQKLQPPFYLALIVCFFFGVFLVCQGILLQQLHRFQFTVFFIAYFLKPLWFPDLIMLRNLLQIPCRKIHSTVGDQRL